jgi:hypothetical protein
VPVEHTRQAREIMGPDAFLAVEQAVVLDTGLDRAREVATAHVASYVSLAPHQAAKRLHGRPPAGLGGEAENEDADRAAACGGRTVRARAVRTAGQLPGTRNTPLS